MKILLYCALIAQLISSAPTLAQRTNEAWRVSIELNPDFPPGYAEVLTTELVYPSPERAVLKSDPTEGGAFYVVPTQSSQSRPSHVDIAISGFGLKRQVLSTGILRFGSAGWAQASLHFEVALDHAPTIEQITKLDNTDTTKDVFELTIFNPASEEINVSYIDLAQRISTGVSCLGPADSPEFTFTVGMKGTRLVGKLREVQPSSEPIAYDLEGVVTDHCSSISVQFGGSFNYPIAAHERLYFRLALDKASIRAAYSQLAWRRKSSRQILRIDEQKMHLLINNSLVLTGNFPVIDAVPAIFNRVIE